MRPGLSRRSVGDFGLRISDCGFGISWGARLICQWVVSYDNGRNVRTRGGYSVDSHLDLSADRQGEKNGSSDSEHEEIPHGRRMWP